MTPLTERPRGELLLDLLLRALRVHDERLNALAAELLGRCGQAPIRRLVREAVDPTNRPAHRVRLLRAIRRIGRITDLAAFFDLYVLGQDKHPAIRSAAAQLLADLGHQRADAAPVTGRALPPKPVRLPAGKRSRAPACGDREAPENGP
jgi:hypothetical protein